MDINLSTLTLGGLVAIGVVNVSMMFQPNLDSKIKFGLAFIAALAVSFVPPDLGNVILEKAKDALVIAFASSGIYKVAQKMGGS